MSEEDQSFPVKLYVYDLSQGMARAMSPQIIGIQIDAIYHTSLVVHGKEFFFSRGISFTNPPGSTIYGQPIEVVDLGETFITEDLLNDYLDNMKAEYHENSYDLFQHNCNHFSNELSDFLVNKQIPSKIRDLPSLVLSTPMGQMFSQMLSSQLTAYATSVGPNDHSL
ncbi:hypothetical protein DASC09_002150 [Saccharomycopsis crataegensis]|uniref:PPPDE domain-containing protein n=1 Tax=Saccharomycopsis crataegensis TaxID=43959 RepID=A0AAV5QD78_9ASCO|nr:hypothetical protein DASC09_002150 [Saccharomycopsis crataegensis]